MQEFLAERINRNEGFSGKNSEQKQKNFWRNELIKMEDILTEIVNTNERLSGGKS